jgi:hypothetical protein
MRLEVRQVNCDILSGVTKTEETASPKFAMPEPASDCARSWPTRGVPLGMHQMNPEHLDPDPSDHSAAADVLLREEREDEEEEEDHGKDRKDDDNDGDDGYSE